jgi:hypothetical protein
MYEHRLRNEDVNEIQGTNEESKPQKMGSETVRLETQIKYLTLFMAQGVRLCTNSSRTGEHMGNTGQAVQGHSSTVVTAGSSFPTFPKPRNKFFT